MSFRKCLVLAGIVVFGAVGDVTLSHGMKRLGAVSAQHWTQPITAVFTPWVALGILFLLIFFASYLTSLSWADLTFVLPAASLGYVLVALLSVWLLHENVTLMRWLGILLVSSGVGIVTRGPALTPRREPAADAAEEAASAGGQP